VLASGVVKTKQREVNGRMNIPANDYSQTIRLQRPNQKHGFHFMRFLIGPLHSCLLVSAGVPCALCCIAPITWRPLPTNAPDEVRNKRCAGRGTACFIQTRHGCGLLRIQGFYPVQKGASPFPSAWCPPHISPSPLLTSSLFCRG